MQQQAQGLSKDPVTSGKYLNFKDGKIICGNEAYGSVTGRIVELDVTDEVYLGRDYKKLTLFLMVNGDILRLGFALNSGYGNAFQMIMPNIKFDADVTISADSQADGEGKKKTSLFVHQFGKALKWFWTKDKPGKLPQPTIKKDKSTDWTKRNDYLLKLLYEKVRPEIIKLNPGIDVDKTVAKKKAGVPDAGDITEPLDDLPF